MESRGREGSNNPEDIVLATFLDEYNRSLFGVLVSDQAVEVEPVEVADVLYPYVKRVEAPGFTTTFLQNISDGEEAIITSDPLGQNSGVFILDRLQEEVYFHDPASKETQTVQSDRLWGLAQRLKCLNDWYENFEQCKLSEELENRFRISFEKIISGQSNHPLVSIDRRENPEPFTSVTNASINDSGLFIRLSRIEKEDGSIEDYIGLIGKGVPKNLQGVEIYMNFKNSLYFTWNRAAVLDVLREERTYIGEEPHSYHVDTEQADNKHDTNYLLTDTGAEEVLALLSPYENGANFDEDEKHQPPPAELLKALSSKIKEITSGQAKILGMTYDNSATYYKQKAELRKKTRTKLHDSLWLEATEDHSGNQTVSLTGKKVPSDIRNMEFRLDALDGKLAVTRLPENVESVLLYKYIFLAVRQEIRERAGYYYKEFLASHRQAKTLSIFLDSLSESR